MFPSEINRPTAEVEKMVFEDKDSPYFGCCNKQVKVGFKVKEFMMAFQCNNLELALSVSYHNTWFSPQNYFLLSVLNIVNIFVRCLHAFKAYIIDWL